jgi:DNA helicase HerA-like ATPase
VNVVVSLLCRLIFDFALWSDRTKGVPLLLVCDEAHRYVPNDNSLAFEPTRRAISRIAKEGRKYGVSLCLVTQRPSEIVNVVVSLLCRLIFDFALWSDRTKAVPILLVCDEAHRYVPNDNSLAFEQTRRAISRIAKEGRKYGVSLCLVTQRPSEISESILSQCSTVFAMRMTNDKDQNLVRRTLPETAAGLLNTLPTLRQQEAIAVGEGVPHPMRIRFRSLDPSLRPQGDATNFPKAWATDTMGTPFLTEVVDRWRWQSH